MGKMFGKLGASLPATFWSTPTRKLWTSVVVGLLLLSVILRFVAPVPPPHVALSGEPIPSTSPRWFTNSLLMTIIVDIILLALALATRFSLKEIPSGLQNAMEMVVETLYGLAESVAGKNAASLSPGPPRSSCVSSSDLERPHPRRRQHRLLVSWSLPTQSRPPMRARLLRKRTPP